MDINKFKNLKKDIITLRKSINNLLEQDEPEIEGDGGLFDGDFNSEASKQSWEDFFFWYSLSPTIVK